MVWLDKSYQNFQHYLHQQIHHQGSTSKATWVSWITLYIRFSFKAMCWNYLITQISTVLHFFECVKAAHNDFCTKLPNYLLYHFFSIFSSGRCKKRGHITYISKKREFFWRKNRKKLPNYIHYRGFHFLGRLKVAHIEPYLIFQTSLVLC